MERNWGAEAASTNRVVREILSVEMPIKLKPEKRRGPEKIFRGHTHTHANHRHTYTHKYTCTHAEMHTCTHKYAIQSYTHMYPHKYTHMQICTYTYTYIHPFVQGNISGLSEKTSTNTLRLGQLLIEKKVKRYYYSY